MYSNLVKEPTTLVNSIPKALLKFDMADTTPLLLELPASSVTYTADTGLPSPVDIPIITSPNFTNIRLWICQN